jgi:hypothetical protein
MKWKGLLRLSNGDAESLRLRMPVAFVMRA